MYIKDQDNKTINAEFSISLFEEKYSLIIESRSGTPNRNPDYNKLLEELLFRLKENGLTINAVFLASRSNENLEKWHRRIEIENHPYPISTNTINLDEFRKALQKGVAKKESKAKSGGNGQKRIEIVINEAANNVFVDNELEIDYGSIENIDITERESIIKSRIGQGTFRNSVSDLWQNKCSITQISLDSVLIASHIKPWAFSSNFERLDPNNGLFLSATLDKLFDKGFISFDINGKILISKEIGDEEIVKIGLDKEFQLHDYLRHEKYLDYHRKKVFRKTDYNSTYE